MCEKLPREIRDRVYQNLCYEDRHIPIGPYYHFRSYKPPQSNDTSQANYYNTQFFPRHGDRQTVLSDGRIRTDHDVYPADDLILPETHVFQPSYTSEQVAAEALEVYYKTNSFSVCNVEGGLDSLCKPIIMKAGGSSVIFPPIDRIRDLQIRLKFEHFTSPYSDTVSNFDIHERLVTFAIHQAPFLRSTVESLAAIRHSIQQSPVRPLNIEIVLMSNLVDVGIETYRVINMLQTVRNFVYELIHDRGDTTVRVTHHDEELMAFPRNCTGFFKLTKEQWDYVSTSA